MYLYQLSKVFKPTKSNVGIEKNDGFATGTQLRRLDGWTTNRLWLVKSDYEPKFIQELRETADTDKEKLSKGIKRILDEVEKATCELQLTNHIELLNETPAVLLKSGQHKAWVNVYLLTLFEKVNDKVGGDRKFYQQDALKPIAVKLNNELIGVLMPIRKSD